jgi:hypothetical protein
MSEIMAAVMILGGPILAVVFAIGVLAAVGLVGYDAVASREGARTPAMLEEAAPAHAPDRDGAVAARMYLERGVARTFVILGASFWGICVVAAALMYQRGAETLLFMALLPFLMNIACLIIGWRWERTASVMLALTGAGAIWWGVANTFEPGVWMLFTILLIGPMLTAAVLFWLARQGEIELALRLVPAREAVPAVAQRSA